MLLDEGQLCQPIARRRIAIEQIRNQPVCIDVDRRQRLCCHRNRAAERGPALCLIAADPGDELSNDVAFFVGHWGTPWVPWRAMWPRGLVASMAQQAQPTDFDHRTAIHDDS